MLLDQTFAGTLLKQAVDIPAVKTVSPRERARIVRLLKQGQIRDDRQETYRLEEILKRSRHAVPVRGVAVERGFIAKRPDFKLIVYRMSEERMKALGLTL